MTEIRQEKLPTLVYAVYAWKDIHFKTEISQIF